jgi:hypothetical protein
MVDTPDTAEEERGARHAADDPYQQVLRSLGHSRAKHLAIDIRAQRPRTLTELFAERDRLIGALAAGGPDPAADIEALQRRRDELLDSLRYQKERLANAEARLGRWRRHRWQDPEHAHATVAINSLSRNIDCVNSEIEAAKARGVERRRFLDDHTEDRTQLDQIEKTIEAGLFLRLGQIGRNPPGYLTSVVGPIPDSRTNSSAWWSAARQVETYRARFDITDQTAALGPAPREASRILEWFELDKQLRSVADRLGHTQQSRRLEHGREQHAELDIGL